MENQGLDKTFLTVNRLLHQYINLSQIIITDVLTERERRQILEYYTQGIAQRLSESLLEWCKDKRVDEIEPWLVCVQDIGVKDMNYETWLFHRFARNSGYLQNITRDYTLKEAGEIIKEYYKDGCPGKDEVGPLWGILAFHSMERVNWELVAQLIREECFKDDD